MAFVVQRLTARYESEDGVPDIISHLAERGFNPLIKEAKQRFYSVFGEAVGAEHNLKQQESETPSRYVGIERGNSHGTYYEDGLSFLTARLHWALCEPRGSIAPVRVGDLFLTPGGKGLLYTQLKPELASGESGEAASCVHIEIGYLGDDEEARYLDDFVAQVEECVSAKAKEVGWCPVLGSSDAFNELAQDEEIKFLSAASIPSEDLELAAILDNRDVREVAAAVNRAGGMLAGYFRKRNEKSSDMRKVIEDLTRTRLLVQEYVVICRQTSNQINKVQARDTIEKMAEMGVLCSCGRPVRDELVEEIFSPTPALHKMLDKSYWMAVRLVNDLESLGVPRGCILLDLSEGPNEIHALADVHGTVLMFELRDGEFSMGHAYPFAGRIGLYKPDYAILVSTKGVDGEAKEYFGRVKPQARIVCVDRLEQLAPTLSEVVTQLRHEAALEILSSFNHLACVSVPLAQVIGPKIGLRLG